MDELKKYSIQLLYVNRTTKNMRRKNYNKKYKK